MEIIKIKINELGSIRNSEIEFSPLMIFSGESSVGKSYTAFLVYHFTSLFKNDWENRIEDHIKAKYSSQIDEIKKNKRGVIDLKADDFIRWFNHKASAFIGYLLGHTEFKCNIELMAPIPDFDISIAYPIKSNNIEEVLGNTITFTINGFPYNVSESIGNTRMESAIAIIYSLELKKHLFKNERFIPLLLPPSRAGIVGYNFSELTKISTTAGMYKEFIKGLDAIKSPDINVYNPPKELTSLLENIFGGQIKTTENNLEYQLSSVDSKKESIPITAAASSIKELSPLSLILNKYDANTLSILFEEPEAHLHPTMQQNVALILAYIINRGGYVQTTTHSDYLLNQINNLIKLHTLKHKNPIKFKEIITTLSINENLILDPKMVGAYYFEKQDNGSVQIKRQSHSESGIPFDTFKKAVDKLMSQSNLIDESLEENYDH